MPCQGERHRAAAVTAERTEVMAVCKIEYTLHAKLLIYDRPSREAPRQALARSSLARHSQMRAC